MGEIHPYTACGPTIMITCMPSVAWGWFYGPLLAILISLGGIKMFPIATGPLIVNGSPMRITLENQNPLTNKNQVRESESKLNIKIKLENQNQIRESESKSKSSQRIR